MRGVKLAESRSHLPSHPVINQAGSPLGHNVQEFRPPSDLVLETPDNDDRQTFDCVDVVARLAFVPRLWVQRAGFFIDWVCVVRAKSLVPHSELAHDSVSGDTIEPPIMPFSSLNFLQLLLLLSHTLPPPQLILNLFLVICVDIAKTSPDDIQDLLELIG